MKSSTRCRSASSVIGGKYVVYGSSMLAALVVILAVVNRRGNPAAKITWILLIMLAPVFAIPFYFYVDMDLGHHLVRRRLEQVQARTARYAPPQLDALSSLWERSPGLARIARYVEHTSGQSFYQRSGVKYLPTGEAVFEEMLRLHPAGEGRPAVHHQDLPVVPVVVVGGDQGVQGGEHPAPDAQGLQLLGVAVGQLAHGAGAVVEHPHLHPLLDLPLQSWWWTAGRPSPAG